MNDRRMPRENRDDALERILAETAKNPYTPKKAVRPASQPVANSRPAAQKPVTQRPAVQAPVATLEKPSVKNENPNRVLTEAQKAEIVKARVAKKIEETKRARKMQEEAARLAEKPVKEQIPNDNLNALENKSEINSEIISHETFEEKNIAEESYFEPEEFDEPENESAEGVITLNDILDIVESMIAVILVVLMFFTYIIRVAVVDGESMSPTLKNDDKLIVRSIGYKPDNGDIIVINNEKAHLISESGKVVETDGLEKVIVKRVIATGGQTVDIDFENGIVTIDGKSLDETYISELTTRDEYAFTYPVTIPEGYVFAMGDNRNLSKDSRHPEIGLIPEDKVVGEVILRIYPFGKFGGIE